MAIVAIALFFVWKNAAALSGLRLETEDGTPSVALESTIPAQDYAVEITPYSVADFNNALRSRTERAVTFRPFLTFGAILTLAGIGYIAFLRVKKMRNKKL